MTNHRTAAALLLIVSFLVAVVLSGVDARATMRPTKTVALLRRDAHGQGYVAHAAAPMVSEPEPTCDDNCDEAPEPQPKPEPKPEPEPEPPTCSTCEEPEPEPKSELTCNKVHGVQAGETCYCLAQGVGLTLDDFLGFNPNICCDNLFVGQWVCLNATSGCHD